MNSTLPQPHPKYGNFYIEEAFRRAADIGDLKQLEALLQAYPKLNVNAQDEYGQTALYLSAKHNQTQTFDKLISLPSVDINVQTLLGNSPMLISAWNDNNQQVKKLLDHGADANAKTNADRQYHGGVTVLDIAKERNNPELINLLEAKLSNKIKQNKFFKQEAETKIEKRIEPDSNITARPTKSS